MISKFFKWFFKTTVNAVITTIIVLLIFAGIIGVFTVKQPLLLQPDSTLIVSFSPFLTETSQPKLELSTDLDQKTLSHLKAVVTLQKAAKDPNIKNILLLLDSWNVNRAQNEEIKNALEIVKANGKKIFAYGTVINRLNYSAALIADEIIMPPSASAMTFLGGYSKTIPYYKDLAEKLGIKAEVIHMGRYKGAGENYAKNSMSEELKAELTKIYDKLYNNFLIEVSKKRNIELAKVKEYFNSGSLIETTPKEMKNKGLIDSIQFLDDFKDAESDENNRFRSISLQDYSQYCNYVTREKNIAVVIAEGEIKFGGAPSELDEYSNIYAPSLIRQLRKVRNDETIAACVLRVNSPGGSALASDLILNEIEKIKEKMPLIVSMGGVAASGGYYLSCKADEIFVNKNTITGSIGVVAIIPNVEKLTKKVGINFETVSKGKYADLFNFAKKTSEDELNVIKNSMYKVYKEFKTHVSTGRNIKYEKLEEYAEGRIWTGEQAIQIGLADKIGDLNKSIIRAAELGKTNNYGLKIYPEEKSLLEMFKADKLGSENTKTALISSIKNEMIRKNSSARIAGRISKEIEAYLELLETNCKKPLLYFPICVE